MSVINSRPQKKQNNTWRRRQCLDCEAIFTSVESIDLTNSLLVANNKDQLEPFSRDKLFISLYESLKHRKTAVHDATALTVTVIEQVLAKHQGASLEKVVIAKKALEILSRFDKPAAVHYQAFHVPD